MKVAFVHIVLLRVRLMLAVLLTSLVFRVLLILFHCSQNQKHIKKNRVNLPTIKKQSNGLSSVFQTLTVDLLTETICLS